MKNKTIIFGNKLRSKIIAGITKAAKAIKITLGPKGRNVIIEKKYDKPIITKDGVTVAKEIELKDKLENIGVQLLKEVALKTNETAGDGTTTATVITNAIIKNGMKYIMLGIEPTQIKKEIDFYIKKTHKALNQQSTKITNLAEIKSVSSISANNDKKIGKLISTAIKKVGPEGVITIEEGKSTKDELDIVNGMQIDKGYLSPYFLGDSNKEKITLENAYVLICTDKINNFNELYTLLEELAKKNKQLLIITEDIESEALNTLVINTLRGVIKTVAIKTPSFGEKKQVILEDISILTGANIINKNIGKGIKKATIQDLGITQKIIIEKHKTTIFCEKSNNKKIQNRILFLKKKLIKTNSKFEIEKLKERIAKLTGGIAVIKIGGHSETEVKERKYRIEDSLNATKAAIEEGILPGGGIALFRISEQLKKYKKTNIKSIGLDIVYEAIRAPFKQILKNSDLEPRIVINKIKNNKQLGIDLINNKYCNLIQKGIIDPKKVIKFALLNAASIATLVLTIGCAITSEIKNTKKQ
ncbi:chaperonin GroEL [Candidatus Vidania fulgoroideae]|uniref:60 kDa chaperonin n=1 Tax=Candidatus Vidania fulgoroideorum TaxID=881286 RepID=A0A974X7A8_9PROT|nr:chaperonin GroEL [Candidatus Vidania fulgoroideae]